MTAGNGRAPGGRTALLNAPRARAALCLAAALLACALPMVSHLRAGPFTGQTAVTARGAAHGAQAAVNWPLGAVDVNAAPAEELIALTGIGPTLAEAIVAEREARGPFDYPEDLVMVGGIGVKTLAKFYGQLDFSSRAGAP